jgi:hypothetical protein
VAVGQQTLAKWGTERGLVVLEQGGALCTSGNAAGRRVQLPWGGGTFDVNSLNTSGKTLARRAIEWASVAPGTPMLLVVVDPDVPTAQEAARISLFETFGYRVNTIDESALQADYNMAIAGVGIGYVSEEVLSTNLGTKLTAASIGVLNEEQAFVDELEMSSSNAVASGTQLQIDVNTHYITSPFATGARTIFTSSQEMVALGGTISSDAHSLGSWSGNKALVVFEAGGKTHTGTSFAGRRVQLPWGGGSFDINALNTDGRTILQRAMQWAGGLSGYWRLDETTGTVASDSSGKRNHGTLNGFTFDTATVSPGKLGNALNLNGTTNYISIPNASSLQPTSALSISAWIKGDAWGSGSDVDSILRKGEANPNNYQLAIADGRVALYLDDSDTAGHRGDTVLQAGVWYHVAATWDGSQVKVYVNGLLDHSPPTSKAAPIAVDTRPLYIGGRSGADLFDGVIDDVRLFNYALTPQEILELKGTGQPNGIRIVKWVELP